MTDAPLPPLPRSEIDALLRAAPWGPLHAQLIAYALSRTKNRERAEDAAQAAISRVLDASYRAWDPRVKSLKLFLMDRVSDELSAKRKRVHREIAMASGDKASAAERAADIAASKVAAHAPSPETQLVEHDLHARRLQRLRDWFVDHEDGIAVDTLACVERGLVKPAEIALALGKQLPDVIKARERLVYRGQIIARELDDGAATESAERDEDDERSEAPTEDTHANARYDESPESTEDVA